MVNHSAPFPFGTPPLEAHMWYHLCLTVNDSVVKLDIGNEEYEVSHQNVAKLPRMGEGDVEHAYVMLGNNHTSFEFFGQIADISLYQDPLSQEEIQSFIECGSDISLGLEYSLDNDVQEHSQKQARSGLCRPRPDYFAVLFSGLRDQRTSKEFCEHLGARLASTKDDYSYILSDIFFSMNAQSMATVWTEDQVNQVADHHVMLFLMKMGNESSYMNMSISSTTDAANTLCMVPFGKKIYMLRDKREEYTFFSRKGRLVLQGLGSSLIFISKCPGDMEGSCIFYSKKNSRKMYHVYDDNSFLLGRREWRSLTSKGTQERAISVTLTACDESQFTCNNSQCVDLENRCTGMAECEDLSDEGDTCRAMDHLPLTYWSNMCPHVSGRPPLISLFVQLVSINEISLENNEFKATLTVSTQWKDARLTFSNLGNCTNKLLPEIYESIWVPAIAFENANYDDNRHIQQGTEILQSYTVEADGTNYTDVLESFEATKNNGTEALLRRTIKYLFKFSCDYEYQLFPFDIQECDIVINLPSQTYSCPLAWDPARIAVFGNSSTISTYHVDPVRYVFDPEKGGTVKLKLLFTRKFDAYLLTTFLPCVLLCVLSELTLFYFDLDAFTDRIAITLSLLIVLASLFAQVATSMPASPSPKLVDIFFFYCILRVSLVFLLHSAIDRKKRDLERKEKEGSSDDVVVLKDLDIKMNIAWSQPSKSEEKAKTTSFINNMGLVVLMVLDAAAVVGFVVWILVARATTLALYDTYSK
ncbi:uncharacterized protein [Penaeus vannamei]|uniref:uncharacterized protein n=1 Tax=Penaeus vannamei TaxID=6689 RepID=UPI00387F7D85